MLSRNPGPQPFDANGVSQAFSVLEHVMSTDPKEQDGIKDEELERVSGGTAEQVRPVDASEPDADETLHATFPEQR
jgi:hypothetical protein